MNSDGGSQGELMDLDALQQQIETMENNLAALKDQLQRSREEQEKRAENEALRAYV